MSIDKSKVKQTNGGAVVDNNNDHYDPDIDNNTGGSQVVVMLGGKPALAGSKRKIVEEPVEKTDEEAIESNVRTTILPDMLDSEAEEVVVKQPEPKKAPKKISRIPVAAPAKKAKPRKK